VAAQGAVGEQARARPVQAKKKLEGSDLKAFAAQMKTSLRNARGPGAKSNGAKPSQPSHPNAPGNGEKNFDPPF
jgi:hypothetical protein